jgi:hypothetical protein
MRLRIAVLATALSALTFVALPGISNAAPRHNHGLTINATPNPIIAGDPVLIYGQLNLANQADQTIRLYHRINPKPFFTLIGVTKTNAQGFYEFTREEDIVLTNRNWFVRGPDATHSRTVHELVAAEVSLAASQTSGDTLHPLVFTGQVTPDHAGQRVYLQAQKGAGDDWTTLKSGRLGAGSNYSIAYRWRIPGERDLRVLLPADARNTASTSTPVAVTIQQTQNPDFTIGSSSPIMTIGGSATISGTLDKARSTTGEPTTSVTLWAGPSISGPFRAIQSVSTGSEGSYSFTEQPTQNEVYYVRTTFSPFRHTARLFEGVQDAVTLSASSSTSTVGGQVTFTGSVTPDKAGHVIYLERMGKDGDWHLVEIRFVNGSSNFQFGWTFGTSGAKTFRARITGDGQNVGGASPSVTVTVSPAPVSSLPPPS